MSNNEIINNHSSHVTQDNILSNSNNRTQSVDNTNNNNNNNNNTITNKSINYIKSIFSLSNILFILWFLVIYFIIFYFIKTFYKNDIDPLKEKMMLSRGIDIFIFGLIILITIYSYWSLSEKDKQHLIGYWMNFIQKFYDNPNSFFNTFIFIILFYCFVYFCGVPMTKETRPISIGILENKLWIVLITVIIVDFFIYVLNIPIIDLIFGINGGLVNSWYKLKSEIVHVPNTIVDVSNAITDVSNNIPAQKNKKPEVFNISNNLYDYNDAQAVCKVFNADLATIEQVEQAYDEGGEWCVNSWSDGQLVLYPTQKSTYDRLQKIKGHEHSCGRTGVNGGYVEDKSLRFGVNCYGIKPDPNDIDIKRLNSIQNFVPPSSKEDIILNSKVEFWKNNKDKYAILSPFNNDKWSYN